MDETGTLLRVTYGGYAGTYYQPPEPAEMIVWCPVCKAEVDAYTFSTPYPDMDLDVTCGSGHDIVVTSPV